MNDNNSDKQLDGLVGGDGDREFIINICVASAMAFGKRPTIKNINDTLVNEGQTPLTKAEMLNLKNVVSEEK